MVIDRLACLASLAFLAWQDRLASLALRGRKASRDRKDQPVLTGPQVRPGLTESLAKTVRRAWPDRLARLAGRRFYFSLKMASGKSCKLPTGFLRPATTPNRTRSHRRGNTSGATAGSPISLKRLICVAPLGLVARRVFRVLAAEAAEAARPALPAQQGLQEQQDRPEMMARRALRVQADRPALLVLKGPQGRLEPQGLLEPRVRPEPREQAAQPVVQFLHRHARLAMLAPRLSSVMLRTRSTSS